MSSIDYLSNAERVQQFGAGSRPVLRQHVRKQRRLESGKVAEVPKP